MMKRRGRPKKIKLTDDELFEEILFKAYNISLDADGKLRFDRNNTPLTLQETAFMIWNIEGRKTKKPLSKMMMIKVECKALQKMKAGLAKVGITRFDDVFGARDRSLATDRYGYTDSPE